MASPRLNQKSDKFDLPDLPERPLAQTWLPAVITLYMLMMVVGVVVFHSSAAMNRGTEMNYDRAIFTAVNASTLTGFQQRESISDYKDHGQHMILLMTVGGTLFTLITGGWALVRILKLPYSDSTIVVGALVCEAAVFFIGGTALIDATHGTTAGILQATSAFGNSGLCLGSLYPISSWQTQIVLMPLCVLGGLGLPVLLDIFDSFRHRRAMSAHTRRVLMMTAGIYVVGTLVFLALLWVGRLMPETDANRDAWSARTAQLAAARFDPADAVVTAATATVNARSAGFPFKPLSALPRSMQWTMLLLMIIGANPGGTGGGVKTTTVSELWLGARLARLGKPVGRVFGVAALWLVSYLGLIMLVFLMLLSTEPAMPADRLLFLAVSAVGNVGISHDVITVTTATQIALSLGMLLGRLLPLIVLWWMAESNMEADVAIG